MLLDPENTVWNIFYLKKTNNQQARLFIILCCLARNSGICAGVFFFLYLFMKKNFFVLLVFLSFLSCKKDNEEPFSLSVKLLPPPEGEIYHNAYPDFDDTEDKVNRDSILHFESLAEKEIGWVFFSNNWLIEEGGIRFPSEEVEIIHAQGKIPYIRMMPRSRFEEGKPDPVYTMDKFLSGDFDMDLHKWAQKAKSYDFPLLVEFGTEMNGFWFPWNGMWNGKDETDYGNPGEFDGPEKFKNVYRRIIEICKEEKADNITWFFHINGENDPVSDWNKMKNYYPGDEYIDWIGVSIYGALESSEPWRSFEEVLSENWEEISSISPSGKPIAIAEWGVMENPSAGDKAQWISDALHSLTEASVYAGQIKALSYWNEAWENENERINLRIDSSPQSLNAYRQGIKAGNFTSKLRFNNK